MAFDPNQNLFDMYQFNDADKAKFNRLHDDAKNNLSGWAIMPYAGFDPRGQIDSQLAKQDQDDYQTKQRNLNTQQQQQATDFRNNLPQMEEDLGSSYERQARRGLAQNIQGINANASRRGLLYSGLRQGAEAGAQARTAGDVAQKRYQINQGLEQNAQGLESGAASNIFSSYKNDIQNADDSYNLALQQMQSRNNLLTGLFGGIGAAAGGYLGRK